MPTQPLPPDGDPPAAPTVDESRLAPPQAADDDAYTEFALPDSSPSGD